MHVLPIVISHTHNYSHLVLLVAAGESACSIYNGVDQESCADGEQTN